AQRLMNAEDVRREVPFTYARADEDGDHQIVQGIVDCLFKENGEWILLDYKTDQTRGMANVQSAMKERYTIQLSVYQEAVEAILRIAIKERILYLFSTNEEVEV
ncbi:MAG: PD-(D/E)XK nuclease family protein, partial [Planococcus sp. (in: firmicutes)]|nr:PD-(D/E)XK nuclease family protein [Planococcus sp. (in: firmicutes)]